MKNDVRSSKEQREQMLDAISNEIEDMFTYQQWDYREVFYIDEFNDVGMSVVEFYYDLG